MREPAVRRLTTVELDLVGVALTAAWLRDFWTYDDRTDEHALAEREVRQAAGE